MDLWIGLSCISSLLVCLTVIIIISILVTDGVSGLLSVLLRAILYLPGMKALVSLYLKKEVRGFLNKLGISKGSGISSRILAIPEKGLANEKLLEELQRRKAADFNPDSGKGFAYVYTVHNQQFQTVQKAFDLFQFNAEDTSATDLKENISVVFFRSFLHENALNPMVFPSLRLFEVEVVAMTAWMLNGPKGVVGNITSGGTESILMAVKTYRDRARALNPSIKQPEMVAPVTVHPAFEKAAAYFDVKVIHVPISDSDYRVDINKYKKCINSNTILLIGSAPEYCHGIIDPIPELSKLALTYGLPLHVDACFGGFMLPWVEKLGYNIKPFDFRLGGVTSISADVHKYGLGPKGASVVLYRSSEIRKYQVFAYTDWPGGLFGSPSMSGTRPGGNIASSWAAIMSLGQEGYLSVAERLMNVTLSMKEGIRSVPELSLCGESDMTAFAFTSSSVSVFAVADVMEGKGWKMERGSTCIHCTVLPSHNNEIAKEFINNLKESVSIVKANPSLANKGSAGVYGMAGKIPERGLVKDFVVEFFNEIYTL
ncbi:PREDICTED: sphingosine-1-phosphate lyase-like [Amphimedon queenslandica]|uniref:sphinganine-1-phosphate aldolase n=1 Tax=Amphimedon queenslandica TaxID=400682 RepID=A0A1X7UAI2_AMPQE|nr:PREDICTED: sphingosine-1-phosphate lyase-like [Amphimedon queenslandica]|eukprot:XP_019855201.1 PREDICTED: sphingosine-1-phosphate lyase-like [Amphimedon queenslandica]